MKVPAPPGHPTPLALLLLLHADRKVNTTRARAISGDFPARLDTSPPDNARWERILKDDTTASARLEGLSFSQF